MGISCRTFKNPSNEKLIVYIGETLPPRIARVAKWSKRLDKFTTVLLCHKQGYVEKFSNPDIDNTILFRNEWHLKRLIKSIPAPYIIHAFAPKSKYPFIAKNAWKRTNPHIPFVVDYQDVFTVYYGTVPRYNWLKEELPCERACLSESDGIVANSLEPREGMKIWSIKKSGKRIFFPLYADNDYFLTKGIEQKIKQFSLDDLHLVYAGGVVGSHRDKVHYGATQFHWLIEYLTYQKIHFHIYPSPSVIKADYEEYEQISKNSEYFHFHSPVSQSKLPEELAKYHYGLMPFFRGLSGQSDLKYKYATTLKLFNYVESGVPILVGADVLYQSWIVERYSLGRAVAKEEDFKDVRKLINDIPYEEQVKKIMESREKLSLKKHTPRLLKFYESLQH